MRHDGLGDFLGKTHCSKCGEEDGIIKCKDCSSGKMLKCSKCILSTHEDLPLHRIEVRCNTCSSKQSQLMRTFISDGTAIFLRRTACKILAFTINLAIRVRRALVLILVLLTSLYSTCLDPTTSPSTIANVEKNRYLSGPSYCVKDGFRQLTHVHKPFSCLTALRPFMNSRYKGRQTFTTITTPFYEDQITQISQHQL